MCGPASPFAHFITFASSAAWVVSILILVPLRLVLIILAAAQFLTVPFHYLFCLVGIATRYGMEGPVIQFRWGARFSALVQTGPRAHPASYTIVTGSFPAVKQPGLGVYHPPHLAPRLKKEYSYTFTPPLYFRSLF